MELLVAADSYFQKTPDGKFWCKTIYSYNFWKRYLQVFEKVAIVSRTIESSYRDVEGYLRVDGPQLRVIELPAARGMKQYIQQYKELSKSAKRAVDEADCALIRLPSVAASVVLKYFKKTKKPYALEVVADPYDAYKSNKIAQYLYTRSLKKAVKEADGVSYVTQFYLQDKYPAKIKNSSRRFESYFSTINLESSYFSTPKEYSPDKKKYTIVHTANSINNTGKGHDILIQILNRIRSEGYDVKVIFIGDGDKRSYFEELSLKLNVHQSVHFTGVLSSAEEVRNILLSGDLFVFPSKAEGLPRAVIEAMAVGLPVLSTSVNGIPELLDKKYLFDPSDVEGFVFKLKQLIENPDELEEMSEKNIDKAKEYLIDKLEIRRNSFYTKLKDMSE